MNKVYITPTGALITADDFYFLSDEQKGKCHLFISHKPNNMTQKFNSDFTLDTVKNYPILDDINPETIPKYKGIKITAKIKRKYKDNSSGRYRIIFNNEAYFLDNNKLVWALPYTSSTNIEMMLAEELHRIDFNCVKKLTISFK